MGGRALMGVGTHRWDDLWTELRGQEEAACGYFGVFFQAGEWCQAGPLYSGRPFQAEEALAEPLVWGDFQDALNILLTSDNPANEVRLYQDLGTFEHERKIFEEILENYNQENKAMNLVRGERQSAASLLALVGVTGAVRRRALPLEPHPPHHSYAEGQRTIGD